MRLRDALYAAGWGKHVFKVATSVDGRERQATSHEVDHVQRCAAGTLALEIEWNNKDPFFDRDLESFQRLHAQGAISVGVLVTRGSRLQAELAAIVTDALTRAGVRDPGALRGWGVKARTERQDAALRTAMARGESFAGAFAHSFVADKFGAATTHWAKLADRIRRGVGNPCPMLLLGLPLSAVEDYSAASLEL
jgi:Restriction endonuclease BglII